MVDSKDAAVAVADQVYDDLKEKMESAVKENDLDTVRHIIESGFKYPYEEPTSFHRIQGFDDGYLCHLPNVVQAGEYPAFLDSIAKGDFEMVTLVLKAEPDLDCMDMYGYGPLHLACAIKERDVRWKMVKLVMDAGVTVVDDGLPKFATTCVHQAVAVNDFGLVKCLLDAGATLNCLDSSDQSPLHSAYLSIPDDDAFFAMIKLLVNAGADINFEGKKGSTFMHFVCANELCEWELVKLLLDLGAHLNIVNKYNVSPLALAACGGNFDLVKNMIEAGADINISQRCTSSPLQLAVTECNKSIVELLLDHGADIQAEDDDGKNILTYAAEIDDSLQERAIEQLLHEGQSDFYSKKMANYKDILGILLAHGVGIKDQFGKSLPFQSVLRRGSIEAMNLFMAKSVRLETCGVRFPLHLAASNPHYEILEYLLGTHLYDVDELDDNGLTPLYIAAQYRHCASTVALIKHGADVNIVCKEIVGKDPIRTVERTILSEALVSSSMEEYSEPNSSYFLDDLFDSIGHFRLVEFLLAAGASMKDREVYRGCIILADGARAALTERRSSVYLRELIKCVTKQMVLLRSQNDPIDSECEDYFFKNVSTSSGLMEQCMEELEQLKTVKIYGSTTLYDLLTGRDITFMMSNQRIVDNFKSIDFDRKFRNYGSQLINTFSIAQHKRKLMGDAKAKLNEALGFYFDNFEMILYRIMIHLPLKDIIKLCHMSALQKYFVTS